MRYVPELKRMFLSLSVFDYLVYCTKIEHDLFKMSHGALIIVKASKMYGLYYVWFVLCMVLVLLIMYH